MTAGVKTEDFTKRALIDEVLGNREGSTVRQSIQDLAIQLLATAEIASALVSNDAFLGEWDASAGAFPSGALKAQYWRVSVAGTVDGVSFQVSDVLMALVDDASTSVYAGQWHRVAYAGFAHNHPISEVVGLSDLLKDIRNTSADMINALARSSGLQSTFWYHDDQPLFGIADENGLSSFVIDAQGRVQFPTNAAFNYPHRPLRSFVWKDTNGVPIVELDENHQPVFPHKAGFDTGPIGCAARLKAKSGETLFEWDADGRRMPSSVTMPMPLVHDGKVYAVQGAQKELVDLGAFTALSVAPHRPDAVRAVIDRPGLGAHSSVVCAPKVIIPDARDVLHVTVPYGQSNAVSRMSDDLVTQEAKWPKDNLMPKLAYGAPSDVRLGLVYPSGQQPAPLDGDRLVGFEPHVARVTAGSDRGQTVAESYCQRLTTLAKRYGASFRTVAFTPCNGGIVYDNLKLGTQIFDNLILGLTRLKELAARNGLRLQLDNLLWVHGESDSNGAAGYAAKLLQFQSDVTAAVQPLLNQEAEVHILMSQPSSTTQHFNTVLDMLAVHNSSPYHHLCLPDYAHDGFAPDYLHINGRGNYLKGLYFARAAERVHFTAHEASEIVQMTGMVIAGSTVTISYEVPDPPLVIDTDLTAEMSQYGYRFFDSAGEPAITDVQITGPAEVTLTLDRNYSGAGGYVTYAMTPQGSERSAAGIVRGNVFDSSREIDPVFKRRLRNAAVHQQLAA